MEQINGYKDLARETAKQGEDISQLKADNAWIKQELLNSRKDIKEIKEALLGRPSWWVAGIITALSSLVVALGTYIIFKQSSLNWQLNRKEAK